MSTMEEKAPLEAGPDAASPQAREAAQDVRQPTAPVSTEPSPHDELSPAVRRLVRQFDLDITGIHGTGPSGRIRVGDVMNLLNGRTDSGNRDAPPRPAVNDTDLDADVDGGPLEAASASSDKAAQPTGPTTTVFDCDLSRVLAHRKRLRSGDVELLTTSYVLTALAEALDAAPEITAGHPPRFGLSLTTSDGEARSAFVDTAAISWDSALDERVRAVDVSLRAHLDGDDSAANVLVHHYGESGSVLATPTPIGDGHEASVGIGRVRREIVVRTVDGVESPRVTARCYLSLSFYADRVPLHHANRCLADAVRILETWPE
jgi:pyruvate/2-oxoglutarate dehydrogenase complex dihydrolipoamide acyltransferase (E2) component